NIQQEPSPCVRKDKHCPLKCRAAGAGLYTGKDEGRLCALVCAQHANTAPGA
ncbi:hypothetical protein POSPLADRAFT_1100158, partial [Postia placenta MAD-698-R-SB12]